MRHEDFNSLDIDDVLGRVLDFAITATGATSAHWLSQVGLSRLQAEATQIHDFGFSFTDITIHHMRSQPSVEPAQAFQIWRQMAQLYPQPWGAKLSAHVLSEPFTRYVHPVFFEKRFLGLLLLDKPRSSNPVEINRDLKNGVELASRYLYFAYQHLEAKNESYIDEVTGLHNQRFLPIALEHEIHLARRDNMQFTLLFMDIDYFKMVNDGRGHWVGSKLLQELGNVLKSQVRGCDYTFRYGGDEFIVLLGNTDAEQARIAAERIRKSVERHNFVVDGHNMKLTVSIGLATYPDHAQNAVGLIKLADEAMYYGKRKSRNIVFVAS